MASNVVQVTQEHIDCGVRGDSCTCPIALALRHARKRNWLVRIVRAIESGQPERWELELEISTWIGAFDDGQPVQPIQLVMDTELLTIRLQDSVDSAELC